MKTIKVVLIAIVLLLVNSNSWTQETEKQDIEIAVEDRYELYQLYSAFAFKKNDLKVCDECLSGKSKNECLARTTTLYLFSNLAKGKCDDIANEAYKNLCITIKEGCNLAKNDTLKQMCNALQNKDIKKIIAASYTPYWTSSEKLINEEKAIFLIRTYEAFKDNSEQKCTQYLNRNSPLYSIETSVCDILFANSFSHIELNNLYEKLMKKYKTIYLQESKNF